MVETNDCWRIGERFTVFAEISAEISGRKNCNEVIFALAGQALLRKNRVLGAAELPLRIEIGGLRPLQTSWGFCEMQEPHFFEIFLTGGCQRGWGRV